MDLEKITSLWDAQNDFSITTLLVSLCIGLLLSLAIRWHFKNFGSTLSNREEFSQVFPFILLTTILIITIVKSSIALSLGLVGALSIVRFRTPIKEPEELAYLFIAIAAGLGLGAGQTVATAISVLTILGFMVILRGRWKSSNVSSKNLFITIDLHGLKAKDSEALLLDANNVISKYSRALDLRRYDSRADATEVVYLVDLSDVSLLMNISKDIKDLYPNAGITFLDQNNLPSV